MTYKANKLERCQHADITLRSLTYWNNSGIRSPAHKKAHCRSLAVDQKKCNNPNNNFSSSHEAAYEKFIIWRSNHLPWGKENSKIVFVLGFVAGEPARDCVQALPEDWDFQILPVD
jgi:hypothetical protein